MSQLFKPGSLFAPLGVAGASPYGHPLNTNTGGTAVRAAVSVATVAALAALASTHPACTHGNEVFVDTGERFVFNRTSALTGDNIFVVTPSDTPAAGRWLRMPGTIDINLPITYATADAAVLATLPTGARMMLLSAYWRVTADFTGGSSSAIGVSSNKTGFSTKGDILGGAAGDVAATLVSSGTQGVVSGTIGPKMDTLTETKIVLVAGDTIRFDRITSAFTAGAGAVHVIAALLANPGA